MIQSKEEKLYLDIITLVKENEMLIDELLRIVGDLYLDGIYEKELAVKLIKTYQQAFKSVREKDCELIDIRVNHEQQFIPAAVYEEAIEKFTYSKKLLEHQKEVMNKSLKKPKDRQTAKVG